MQEAVGRYKHWNTCYLTLYKKFAASTKIPAAII